MGETSVYYVPEDQDAWSGRGEELADKMWEFGVFLGTPRIMERLRTLRDTGQPLPNCDLNIWCGGMGVADELDDDPVRTTCMT